jgi:hypothetical protein
MRRCPHCRLPLSTPRGNENASEWNLRFGGSRRKNSGRPQVRLGLWSAATGSRPPRYLRGGGTRGGTCKQAGGQKAGGTPVRRGCRGGCPVYFYSARGSPVMGIGYVALIAVSAGHWPKCWRPEGGYARRETPALPLRASLLGLSNLLLIYWERVSSRFGVQELTRTNGLEGSTVPYILLPCFRSGKIMFCF